MSKQPLLTVAVPTYNRCEELAALTRQFLLPACELPEVEVLVCDNSAAADAARNAALFSGTAVRYRKNPHNLGFHGNLLQCLLHARGEWLWIISDDDYVNGQALANVLDTLRILPAETRALMLPFELADVAGKVKCVTNTSADWGCSGGSTLSELITRGCKVPFILFSSAMLRIGAADKRQIEEAYQRHTPNDYMQFFLFATAIGVSGRIAFFHGDPLQRYRTAEKVRFPLAGMMASMERVLDEIERQWGVDAAIVATLRRKMARGWVIWYARHRSGEVFIQQANAARALLWKNVWQDGGLKGVLLLGMAIALPRVVFRHVWRGILHQLLKAPIQ